MAEAHLEVLQSGDLGGQDGKLVFLGFEDLERGERGHLDRNRREEVARHLESPKGGEQAKCWVECGQLVLGQVEKSEICHTHTHTHNKL